MEASLREELKTTVGHEKRHVSACYRERRTPNISVWGHRID